MPHHATRIARTWRSPRLLAAALLALTATGCNHYQVTDPDTDQRYYTTELKTYKGSGATVFKDAVSGDKVTLTDHRVRKMKADAWKQAVADHQGQ